MSKKSSVTAAITNIVKTPTKKGKRAVTKTVVEIPNDPGAPKLIEKLTDKEKAKQIADLLDELRACTVKNEKKRIRRKLRSRGHFGGLGITKAQVKAIVAESEVDTDTDENDDD